MMQLLIEISEEQYDLYKRWKPSERSVLQEIVANGTPLPKVHGRLIDADKAKETMMYEMCGTGYQSMAMKVLDSEFYTPTIIKEDKS